MTSAYFMYHMFTSDNLMKAIHSGDDAQVNVFWQNLRDACRDEVGVHLVESEELQRILKEE